VEGDLLFKLDSFFEYERTLGGFGSVEGGLLDPKGICVSRDGKVYVADSQNDRVVVFDVFGNFLKSFGEKILRNPNGVTVGPDQLVYVANTDKNSVVVFSADGNLILEYENSGQGMLNLFRPTDLKLERENRLLVVDSGNNRILVFELLR